MENQEKQNIIQHHWSQLGQDCPCVLRANGKLEVWDPDRMPSEAELLQWKAEFDAYQIEQSEKAIIQDYENLVQNHLDSKAIEMGYDSIHTAVTYADEPTVSKFQSEGLALRAWRSLVWDKCYQILADVKAGEREAPTDLLSELPVFSL